MLATSQLLPLSLPSLSPFSSRPLDESVDGGSFKVEDDDLTSLKWLQNPGVLSTMCNALTGSPHRVSAMGTRSIRKHDPSSPNGTGDKTANGDQFRPRKGSSNSAEKMLNVVLSVRNKRYNGEDSHKPPLSFACMIFMALESSPTKTLPVKQIYEWVQWKFPYYQTASPGWKNSIRHNLSLNKCFKKVEKFSKRSKSIVTKGGLWTVDSVYRDSLLAALKLNPYHPYHKYFTPPYFPRSMIAALREELELAVSDKGLDAAERDAALSICLISGAENGGVDPLLVRAIYHDHCYTELPTPPSSPVSSRSGLNLEEMLAAAEMILGGTEEIREGEEEVEGEGEEEEEEEEEETNVVRGGGDNKEVRTSTKKKRNSKKRKLKQTSLPTRKRSERIKRRKIAAGLLQSEDEEDEAYSSEDNSETNSTDVDSSLADSGYNGPSPLSHESRSSSLDDLRGADALLCLANIIQDTPSLPGEEAELKK